VLNNSTSLLVWTLDRRQRFPVHILLSDHPFDRLLLGWRSPPHHLLFYYQGETAPPLPSNGSAASSAFLPTALTSPLLAGGRNGMARHAGWRRDAIAALRRVVLARGTWRRW